MGTGCLFQFTYYGVGSGCHKKILVVLILNRLILFFFNYEVLSNIGCSCQMDTL